VNNLKNNFTIFFLSFITVFLFFESVLAAEIDLVVPERTVTAYAGQNNHIGILVKNNLAMTDTFYISAWPTYWVNMPKYSMNLNSGEATNITIILNPPKDVEEGIRAYTITVTSIGSNASASKQIFFDIVRPSNVFISDVEINKQNLNPSEVLNFKPIITSIDKKQLTEIIVTTKILKDDNIIQVFENTLSVAPLNTETLSYDFNIKTTNAPGEYIIDTILKNKLNKVVDEKKVTFNVLSVHKIDEEKKTENEFLHSTVTIVVINNGNVVESNFYVTESLPMFSKNFFYPKIEPTSQEEKQNRIVYKWLINELAPTEKVVIGYQLRFTNVVVISCILIIAVVWIIWLFFRPALKKSCVGLLLKDKEITISLYLKNKGRKPLNDINVVDYVPPLAVLIKKFDTLEPKITRKVTGTELVWKIKELNPKEERVLTYRIKPIIEVVGDLKLPKAYLVYKSKIGKKSRVLSKRMVVTGKVK
jgi:hypothetical protein